MVFVFFSFASPAILVFLTFGQVTSMDHEDRLTGIEYVDDVQKSSCLGLADDPPFSIAATFRIRRASATDNLLGFRRLHAMLIDMTDIPGIPSKIEHELTI